MRNRVLTLLLSFVACFGCMPFVAFADAPIEDGVYYIECTQEKGYLGLGSMHNVSPYIYYVTDGLDMTPDAYWIVTNTRSGYTFRNEATGELLVFTYNRFDQFYKYMTLASDPLGDKSEFWNIIQGNDGAFSVQSNMDTDYYWNLRAGTNMLGTYRGSWGSSPNERFVFRKKDDAPGPGPGPTPVEVKSFPEALHFYLKDGRIEAYPLEYVASFNENGNTMTVETTFGETFTYKSADVDHVSEQAPTDFPHFDVFRFNKKRNDQVFEAAIGEVVEDTVFVSIAAIGKRLTPTFTLTDEQAEIYVDGVLQESKESRLRFDKDIYYLLARPGCTILLPQDNTKSASYSMQPYGRYVRVHVDWLTDRAEVPTIYINTEDGQAITSKDYYKNATISIDGHGIFPSMEETAVQIKGRGNSSWSWPKKPYRLKFEEKVKPLGMTKGKSWVLLSNYQTGSLMSNAVGMKAANLMGASAANHIVPVDLYLNGEYRGSYNFTEKVGFSNNSVDIADETAAAMLELDSYYDEPEGQKFRSTPYSLPINIKEPDFSEGLTSLTLETIANSFNRFLSTLSRGQDISRYVDLEQLARFMMVNELILNYEFYHPKSTFCYRENFTDDDSKYIFGPVWDLDWGFGYERNRSYFQSEATVNYWTDMPSMEVVGFIQDLRFKYAPLSDIYRELWEEFMENGLQELLEYAQDYYDFAHNSFDQNRSRWGDNTDYARQATQAADWLERRSKQIYDDIINDVRPYIPEPTDPVEFDNDRLYRITCRRGALVLTADHTRLTVEQERYDAPEEDFLFAIINIEGNNYLYSPVTKKYLDYSNDGTWVSRLGTPIDFDVTHPDGQYLYMMTCNTEQGQTLWFNHNSSKLVINGYSTPDPGNRWMVEDMDAFDPTEALTLASASLYAVTNRYIFNGEVIGTETRQMPIGAVPPVPSGQWTNSFVRLIEPDNMPYQIEGETTIDYTVDWGGPFFFSSSETDIYWYNMTIRTDYHVGKQDSEPYYPFEADEETLLDDNYLWAFGGNPYHVVLFNRSTGFSESLTPVGNNAVMRPGQFAWDLLPNRDGFVLRLPGSEYSCINQFGGPGGPLQFWNSESSPTDNGSTFRIRESIVDGISLVRGDGPKPDGSTANSMWFNLAGQRVGHSYKGVVIKNGKKVMVK